jgi:hypothetical protein
LATKGFFEKCQKLFGAIMNRQQRRAAEAQKRKAAERLERQRREISRPGYNPIHDPNFQAGTAKLVRAIDFVMPPEFGPGGLCMFRTIAGMEALRDCKIEAVPYFGSMLYRVGPDPYRDVIAFCGRGNVAWNEALRIEEALDGRARFAGAEPWRGWVAT